MFNKKLDNIVINIIEVYSKPVMNILCSFGVGGGEID